MAVYWQPGSGGYLPTQPDAASGVRRGVGGVAAPSPPSSMLRPGAGYPQVTLPPAAMARYGLPGAVPPTNFPASAAAAAAAYTRQTAAAAAAVQADPRNPRLQIRAPYGPFMGQDGVQLIGVGAPPNSLLASSAQATISTILGPDVHGARRARPVPDARQGSGPPSGGPTAPLTIETRETKENAGYQPQVEAISPTPEDRPAERDDIKSTKDHLLQKIAKVDREIAKAESQIAKLKKKQEELEDAANKPSTDSASEDEKPNQSIAQNVYSENRRKAGQSHAMLNKFSPGNLLPLYNQPSDTELYNKNKKEYTVFKKQLVEYFKRKNEEQESRDREMTVTYCKLSSAWTRKVDRRENSKKRREREAKSREMYEKLFPELRKQREDKVRQERNERLGTRGTVRSDQEIQDVIDKLQEDEIYFQLEEKKMHSYAVVPPPLLPPEDRKRKYIDNNGLMADPLLVYNERKFVNMWTDAEKDTFKEKYLQHPKNFCMIAQYLERKSVSDCVQYYYLSKKTENYKQMLRKPRRTGGNRQSRRVNPPTGEVIAPGIPGVVTRRTVNALQEKEGIDSKGVSRSNTPQPTNKEKDGEDPTNGEKETGRPRRNNAGKKAEPMESSDDEDSNQAVKCGPFPCVVCKTTVESSRPVTKAQATQLGVKEDDITENSRVCSTCWCKTLRTKCPLLSCSSASKSKKLRHLPAKWKELSAGLKEVLSNELQIPEGTKQVCTTCFSRINKRISQAQDDETLNLDKNAATPRDSKETYKVGDVVWSAEEVVFLEMVLRTEGKDWAKVASKVPEKSASECKKFFLAHRKNLDLDTLVAEYKKSVGGGNAGDKPSLSSDEEYSTSSCDDEEKEKKKDGKVEEKSVTNTIVDETKVSNTTTTTSTDMNNTTTVTTNSTTVNNSVGGAKKDMDGYDSAATVSADETHEQDKKHHLPGGMAVSAPGSHLPPPSLPPHTTSTLVSTAPGGATVVNIGHPTTSASMGMGGKPPVPTSAAAFLPPSHMDMQQGPPHNLKQIMDTVIDNSLSRPIGGRQFPGEVSTIKDLLNPSPILGFNIKPPPDLEVKPVPAPPPSGPSPSAAVVVEDSGVLNLTTTKRDRSPQPHPPSHTSLSEPMYRSSFIERGPPTLPGHHPTVNKGEKPPEAHKDSTKTTHREMMDIENKRLKDFNEAVNHLAPSRQEMLSPYHKSYNSRGGSITQGQPIPQPPSQHPGRASSSYHPVPGGPQMKSLSSSQPRGSLVTGTPVYTERNAMNSNDARNAQALEAMKKHQQAQQQQQQQQQQQSQVSRYPQFSGRQPPPGPPSHDSRGSTSRRVIENDFLTAQSLPRKDTHEDLRSPYARVDHRDRDIQIVETHPRFDPRPNIYGNPRGPHPYGPIRTDPKADIPPRGDPTIRTDPRADLRPDIHAASADPRAFQADPRARPGAYPGYPGSMSRDTRPRSPPRSVPTSRPGMPGGSIMAGPRQGGLTSGVPRNNIEIHRQPPGPEVSITKQTRPDYPNTALANFADIALQQPKLTDLTRQQQGGGLGPANSGPGTSSSLTVTRTPDPNAARVQDMRNFALNALKQQYDPRYMTPEHQQKIIESLNEAEREKLRYSQQPGNRHISTDQLIDLIVSNQIKNNIGQPSAAAGIAANLANLPPNLQAQYGLTSLVAAGGLPRLDGKESPSKQPSRSPLVKEGLDEARAMMMRTSPAGGLPQSTLDHMERMKTEVQKNRTSPYPMLPTTASAADMHEYWKRGKFPPGVDPAAYMQRPPSQGSHSGSLPRPNSTGMPAPSNMGTSDERQIIRVAQNASPRSDKGSLGGGRPAIEAISPPTSDPSRSTPNYPNFTDVNSIHRFIASQPRKPEGFDHNSTQILDYIKRKIDEGMKNNEMVDPRNLGQPANLTMGPPNKRPLDNNDRGMGGPSNSGPADLSESPRKRHKMDEGGNSQDLPDSPGSGEMVIDESARPDSAHSQKTTSPAPHPSDYSAYRGGLPPGSGNLPQMPPRSSPSGGMPNYGALNASRGGPPPPATSSGPSGPPPQSQLPPPAGSAPPGARYEPLSDDD